MLGLPVPVTLIQHFVDSKMIWLTLFQILFIDQQTTKRTEEKFNTFSDYFVISLSRVQSLTTSITDIGNTRGTYGEPIPKERSRQSVVRKRTQIPFCKKKKDVTVRPRPTHKTQLFRRTSGHTTDIG